jgi:hypothetical protein
MDGYQRPAGRSVIDGGAAMVGFGEALDDGESEAGPDGLGAEEGVEETLGIRLADARPTVLHSDLSETAIPRTIKA